MKFRHLRTSITIVTSLLIFLIFISFGFITFNLNRVLIRETISTIHKEITNKVIIKMDEYLSTPQTINNLTDSFLRINTEHINNLDLLRKFFYKELYIFKTVNLVAFGTETGNYIEAQRIEDGSIRTGNINNNNLELWSTNKSGQKQSLQKVIESYDPRNRPWYLTSREKKLPAWSDIYLYSSNMQPAISNNQPYFSAERGFSGVITTSITLDGINNFLSELSKGTNSSVLILEPSGLAIANSKGAPLLDNLDRRLTGANLDNLLFSTVSKKFQLSIENNYTNTVSEFPMRIENIRYRIRATPYYGPSGLRWNVLVIIPEADYMSAFYRAGTLGIFIFIIFLLGALLLSYFIAKQTTKPIVQLSNLVSGISLDTNNITKLIIPHNILVRKDEIGSLAEAFSDMEARLGSAFSYLRKSQKEYGDLVENINSIIMRVKPDGTITYCNPFGLNFYGYSKEELIGSTVQETVLNTHDSNDINILERIFYQDEKYWNGINKNITSSGAEVWILWSNTMLFNNNGEIIELLSIGQDFTSQRESELNLNSSLEEKNILLKEVHHRVKNNLQIINSLINLQMEDLSDALIQNTFKPLQSRIQSMSLVHELLYSTDSFTQIDFHDYLNQIIATISTTFNNPTNPIQVTLTGDNLYLDIERATTCGLLVNEIIINAFKHAFPDQKNCRIDISVGKDESGVVSIIIKDNGIGISALKNPDTTNGMGTLLVEALSDQIKGKVIISKSNGTTVSLTFKS
ncbi:MAG: PAS domain S-box protein [Spirochaetia bacterium]|jgi:PAS domain S-box-containing protein|nr:PAS domain S-box protein [Spirochaetia bacterium]